jgi:hypothetical protein
MSIEETTVSAAKAADAVQLAGLINSAYRPQENLAGWTDEVGLLAGTRTNADSLTTLLVEESLRDEAKATILLLRPKADARLFGCIALEPRGDAFWYFSLLVMVAVFCKRRKASRMRVAD